MTDDNGDGMMLSRRDAIRGGAALGTMALASRIGAYAQVVEAQITEPRIQLGSDYAIHDSGGDFVINHDPNGDILFYDASADEITMLKPLGVDLNLSDNDITNVGSLTAGEVNNGGSPIDIGDILNRLDLSKGSQGRVLEMFESTDNGGLSILTQPTDDVSTSATNIVNTTIPSGKAGGSLAVVAGDEQGSTNRFADTLLFNRAGGISVIASDGGGTPAGRTYSRNGAALQLAMASGTYDVVASLMQAERDVNASS